MTGDVFIEHYFWPGVEEPSRVRLPYTWPDDLRSSSPTDWFAEISGAPLHELIIQSFLKTFEIDSSKIRFFDVLNPEKEPGEREIARVITPRHYRRIPVFMHRLGPFAGSGPGASDDRVWRIQQSFGSVEHRREAPDEKQAQLMQEDAKQWLKRMAGRTRKWIKSTAESQVPTIIVINDRDVGGEYPGFNSTRRIFKEAVCDLGPSFKVQESSKRGLLILWHVRDPIFDGNPISDFLGQSDLRSRTIPIINHNCLRDQGVSLRFDMSYESTIRRLLDAIHDGPLKLLLEFPHVLIRFDYGILHLSTKQIEKDGVIGLDVHGLNAGPYRMNSQQFGMVTGTTPLLLCAILLECIELLLSDPPGKLDDLLLPSPPPNDGSWHSRTRLDRALDVGLLLAAC